MTEATTAPLPYRPVAGAPISWGICEVPGWGHQLEPDRVLAEMSSLGLSATELGPDGFLPDDAPRINRLIGGYGLVLVAGFIPAVLHDPLQWAVDRPAVRDRIDLLAMAGAEAVVMAASTGAEGYEDSPELDDRQWDHLASALTEVEAMVAATGIAMRTTLHPHYGTVVETTEQIERLLEVSEVALCLDTGHVMVGGGDPLELARRHATRIGHVHMKDVDAAMAGKVRTGDISYHDAVAAGLYRPLGEGDVDVAAIVRELDAVGYRGWYVLEQDQVLSGAPEHGAGPVLDVAVSLRFLQSVPAP